MLVEYFTKRGRPLTSGEIERLKEEDRLIKEEEEAKKKAEEEAERRRMARLMEDLEDKEDFEEYEKRMKNEEAAKLLSKKRRDPMEDEYGNEFESDEGDLDRAPGGNIEDELGGSYGKSRNRPKSAKTFDEGNLKQARLTTKDYQSHLNS